MDENFKKLLQAAQEANTEALNVLRLWHRLVNDLESEAALFAPVDNVSAALWCLSQHSQLNERLVQAMDNFVQRTGIGDYAVAFNAVCEEAHNNLYIELPQTIICQKSTERDIPDVKPYGLYYTRRRLSELWSSPDVSPPQVASILEAYLGEFKKARASDEHIDNILHDMYEYGYLDELCQVARASRTRSACEATLEAKKVVAAEQALARSLDEAEFTLVSFLTQTLSEHKTICLRQYNEKEQARKGAEISRLQERQDEDRDDYGQILRRHKPGFAVNPVTKPDTTDLVVLKRPYWLYCENDLQRNWVGDQTYGGFVVGYTSDAARKLRFEDDPDWRKVDLDIAHGRLQSFKWHNPVEEFIEVQRAAGQTSATQHAPPTAQSVSTVRRVGYTLESIADRLRQEQDAVMRTSPVGITLIAGAAGSGKTNVAFHRIDYLLQEHPERFSRRNMAVFAPKTSLAKYLRALAGSLQFWSLPVYNYNGWIMGILSNFTDANRLAAEEDLDLSQRKSSVAMPDLIRQYLSDKIWQLKAEIQSDSRLQEYTEVLDSVFQTLPTSVIGLYTATRDALWKNIDVRHEQDGTIIHAQRAPVESALAHVLFARPNQDGLVDDLESVIRTTFHGFPGFKKEYSPFRTRLEVCRPPSFPEQRAVWEHAARERAKELESMMAQFVDLMFAEKRVEQLVLRRVRAEKNRVNARLRAIIKRVCFVAIYARPPVHLASVCETPFQVHVFRMLTEFYHSPHCWEYLGLTETPEHPFGVFELSRADVDVAMWLIQQISRDNLAQEPTASFMHVYDHVVVDEAQDFTPLELLLLYRLSHNSMTLAGDLTQRIFPTGIHDWDELGEPIDYRYVLTMSHRTTLETALFANALMQDASSVTLTERVAYHGDRPLVVQVQDDDSATAAAINYVKLVKDSEPAASVLLVHTRNAALRGLRDGLATIGITGYVAKGDTWEFSDKVTVTTYRRVQGLEYDYVVALGLNDFETMLISGDKSRILYTLATRAKKRLVFYVTKPIPTLLTKVDSSLYDLG